MVPHDILGLRFDLFECKQFFGAMTMGESSSFISSTRLQALSQPLVFQYYFLCLKEYEALVSTIVFLSLLLVIDGQEF